MSNSILIGFLITILLLFGVLISKRVMSSKKKEPYQNVNNEELINREYLDYITNIGKYRIGPKRYEFDFIPGKQPINGLGPNYNQDYPNTLRASNKLIVDQNLDVKYADLLNKRNY